MASIYDDIRAALEVKLNSVSGLPEVAWENLTYEPTTGTSFVKPRLIPTIREPAVRGLNPQIYYQGLFRVDCFVAEGLGPASADELADKIIDAFEATTDVSHNGTIISIRYAEREQGMPDGAFFMVPVNISWYIYS